MSCPRAMLLAVERAYPQSLDAAQRLIRLQLAHVGVRVQVHIGRTDHGGAIARTEPRGRAELPHFRPQDRKSTRLNSSHLVISYAVFCLKKKKKKTTSARQYTD